MSTRRTKARHQQPQAAAHQVPQQAPTSDYDTDTAALTELPPPPPSRSNAELNLKVLRRQDPSVVAILSIAPYAVVYLFSQASQQWEKTGVEGTLFVCQLAPSAELPDAQRYKVIILNRRGLENFSSELLSGDDVDISEQYIILQEKAVEQIYGLWIFSEEGTSTADARNVNAQIIQDCAVSAEQGRLAAMSQSEPTGQQEQGGSVEMGRQLSLRELFGQQRQQDDSWRSQQQHTMVSNEPNPPAPAPNFPNTTDPSYYQGHLAASQNHHAQQAAQPSRPTTAQVDLLSLFKSGR